jgi:hypothetical protein
VASAIDHAGSSGKLLVIATAVQRAGQIAGSAD